MKIVKGAVIGKYGRGEETLIEPDAIQSGKKIIVANTHTETGDYYELTVQGKDERGKDAVKRITVDELTFNTTAIGDEWPRKT